MLRLKICSLHSLLFFILLKGVGQPNQTKQNKTDFLFRDPLWDKKKLSNQEGKKGKKILIPIKLPTDYSSSLNKILRFDQASFLTARKLRFILNSIAINNIRRYQVGSKFK